MLRELFNRITEYFIQSLKLNFNHDHISHQYTFIIFYCISLLKAEFNLYTFINFV